MIIIRFNVKGQKGIKKINPIKLTKTLQSEIGDSVCKGA